LTGGAVGNQSIAVKGAIFNTGVADAIQPKGADGVVQGAASGDEFRTAPRLPGRFSCLKLTHPSSTQV
jgi:hypothetical protein